MARRKSNGPGRKFKGIWIPAALWFDRSLSWMEKLFLAEIASLDVDEAGCFASNSYLAGFFGIPAKRVSVIINQLVDKGRVSSFIDKEKGNVRYLRVLSLKTGIGVSPETGIDYPSKQGEAIPENRDNIYKEDNKGDNIGERETTSPLPDFLNDKTKKGAIYLAAKAGYPITSSGFNRWFENEVLKRFPKFSAASINDTILQDYDKRVFAAFGDEIATTAICELMAETSGQVPNPAKVKIAAQKIKNQQAAAKVAADHAASVQARRDEDKNKRHKPLDEMTTDELKTQLEKYKASEKTPGNDFLISRVQRKIQQLKTKKETPACV
ncbi:MAG: helix-turn-helix domain-containing protein [Planctomycetes bacterium]|nr:helix-turn-helix domain-containing protein [Planctomycetota bacterium]